MDRSIVQAEMFHRRDILIGHLRKRIDFLQEHDIWLDDGQLSKLQIEPRLSFLFRFTGFDRQSAWHEYMERVVGQHCDPW